MGLEETIMKDVGCIHLMVWSCKTYGGYQITRTVDFPLKNKENDRTK